jgi:Cof subfamily protein (haloacid dehalogenase superfamily)
MSDFAGRASGTGGPRDPGPAPQLILLDLDGTLLNDAKEVSDRTAAVLERATAAGARVVIATGRPVRYVVHLRERIHSSIALCANGGIVLDLETGDVLRSHLLDGERVVALAEELRASGAEFAIAMEGLPDTGMLAETHYPFRHLLDDQRMPLADLVAKPMVKLLIRPADGHHDEVLRVLTERYGDVLLATSSGVAGLIEVSLAGISKGTVIDVLAREWGIAAEHAIAFGDQPNDLEMLRWAGRGVAMGNADPALKAEADEVTLTNDEDGVAAVLERWY